MENHPLFISSMSTFHDRNTNHTSFGGNGVCSNMAPRMFQTVPSTDQGQQLATSNYSGSFLERSKKKKKKKVKNSRIAFQTRSQIDVLDDGYRWRKYGQKAVKNNKFPRSYYRCTHPDCLVKKQVQRLTGDESVVVTTYDGIHTHPVQKNTETFENILSQMDIFPIHLK